tara:strand:+ start:961 stop:1128 length:168 start_codon:yes stop_codon:yes gene_type:complete
MDKAAVDPKSVKKGNSHACEKKRKKKGKETPFGFFTYCSVKQEKKILEREKEREI